MLFKRHLFQASLPHPWQHALQALLSYFTPYFLPRMRRPAFLRIAFLGVLFLGAAAVDPAFGQNVAINEDGALPHASAILDLQSPNKGLLTPRLSSLQRMGIAAPATGLMVYQVDGDAGFYYFDGLVWHKMGAGGGSGHWAANALGIHKAAAGHVGIGTDAPQAPMHINTTGFFPNALLLDGSTEGSVAQEFRTRYSSPTVRAGFRLLAGEWADEVPFFELNYTHYNWDYIATQRLARFFADSTLVAHFGGDIRAERGYFSSKQPFSESILEVISEEMALYGAHICMNNTDNGANGIGSHVSGTGTALEAWSQKGTGISVRAPAGKAIIVEEGYVGIGTSEPDAQLTIKSQTNLSQELLLESNTIPSMGMRVRLHPNSYVQYNLDASHTGGLSLWRQDYSENPEEGTAISSYTPIVRFGEDSALSTHGNIDLNGELNTNGGSANMVPIAYGVIRNTGAAHTHTGNVSSTWNSALKRYEITITGQNYYYLDYITVVTPITGGSRVSTSSVGGKLLVTIYDNSNNAVQGNFQFITYKP